MILVDTMYCAYGGIFVLKTICIKTNNKKIIKYLLEELNYFEMKDIYVSCYDFKFYKNLIIHYVGNDVQVFLTKISTLISYVIVDFYEPFLIQKLINTNYFYFSFEEKKEIYNLCLTNVDFKTSISMINIISNKIFEYFSKNRYMILDGFINFMLADYIKELDTVVDICVNKYIIDREYSEFISLLKAYVKTTPANCSVVHLIYKNQKSILLDIDKNIIEFNDNLANSKYLSDISFSTNDFALNSLLSLLPERLYIHLIDITDDFINTLKLIFDNRVYICSDCDLCNLYKKKTIFVH